MASTDDDDKCDKHMVAEMEEDEDEDDFTDDDDEEMDNDDNECTQRVYLPRSDETDAQLEYDETAYVMYHQAQTGSPCLSFDIIQDDVGDYRTRFPLTAFMVAGTQAERSHVNQLIVMKTTNLHCIPEKKQEDDDESDSDEDSEDEAEKPLLECALVQHSGCVNRVRVAKIGGKVLAASWSEQGKVYIWDLTVPLHAVNNHQALAAYVQTDQSPKPLFSFSGHQLEGFAMDWSSKKLGSLATGDCKRNIHLWKPVEGGTWIVDQRPHTGHTDSVEDIQWSPNEAEVFASCSVDKSIRIWDARTAPSKACMLTASDAHSSDVNVLSWNKNEPFLVSGGDDGVIKIWDLRQFQKGKSLAAFKHHTAPITSVEWNPNDSTVFGASGADDQLTLWDLAVEKDTKEGDVEDPQIAQLPPQLLFIHQGQKDIKELHWHPQLPGVIVSTALSGFNVFRTISV